MDNKMEDTLNVYLEKVFDQIDDKNLRKFIGYMQEIYDYNVRDDVYEHNYGPIVIKTYAILAPDGEDKDHAHMLAWLVEIMHSVILMLDDIMDARETRRGKECWYKKKWTRLNISSSGKFEGDIFTQHEVGMIAINDALLLQQHCYEIIRLFLKPKPYYIKIIECFNKMHLMRVYAKMMDAKTNLKECTLEDYTRSKLTSVYKHYSYFLFVFPVKLAMIMNLRAKGEDWNEIQAILIKIGHLNQMLNDYGDFAKGYKVNNDIEKGRLCWPIVTALERCSDVQRKVIKENYGNDSTPCIKAIVQIYFDCDLVEHFRKEVEDMKTDINKSIKKPEHSEILKYVLATFIK